MVGRKSCHQSGYKSILLAAKARLSTSISAPRNKLAALLIVVRLITAVLPGLVDMVDRINLVGDSTCTIFAVEGEHRHLTPWFYNSLIKGLWKCRSFFR